MDVAYSSSHLDIEAEYIFDNCFKFAMCHSHSSTTVDFLKSTFIEEKRLLDIVV